MLPDERRAMVLEKIKESGRMSISELSRTCRVSEMTIRRDLNALQKEGFLRRVHGGASAIGSSLEPWFLSRKIINKEAKGKMAGFINNHIIEERDTIILDGSTTSLEIARQLDPRKNITVVTHGFFCAFETVNKHPSISVIFIGGMVRPGSFYTVGPGGVETLKDIHADKLFISATGFHPESGLTDPNPWLVEMKKAMIKASKEVIVAVDHSKVGKTSFITFAQIDVIDTLVTDQDLPHEIHSRLQDAGINVVVVDELPDKSEAVRRKLHHAGRREA